MDLFKSALKYTVSGIYGVTLTAITILSIVVLIYSSNENAALAIAISASTSASFIALFIQDFGTKLGRCRDYLRLEGTYDCFNYLDNSNTDEPNYYKLSPNESTATLAYLGGMRLSVSLKESNGNEWIGDISMHTSLSGEIAWQYLKGIPGAGTKNMTVFTNPATKKLEIHLFPPAHEKKYGREVLVKR